MYFGANIWSKMMTEVVLNENDPGYVNVTKMPTLADLLKKVIGIIFCDTYCNGKTLRYICTIQVSSNCIND